MTGSKCVKYNFDSSRSPRLSPQFSRVLRLDLAPRVHEVSILLQKVDALLRVNCDLIVLILKWINKASDNRKAELPSIETHLLCQLTRELFRGKLQQESGTVWTNLFNIKAWVLCKILHLFIFVGNNMLQIFSLCSCKFCNLYCKVLTGDVGQWLVCCARKQGRVKVGLRREGPGVQPPGNRLVLTM